MILGILNPKSVLEKSEVVATFLHIVSEQFGVPGLNLNL